MAIVAPSVLSLDFSDFKNQVEKLNSSEAEWIHFDVMDGHFVPNLTFGPDILKAFKKSSDLFMDVHIMVSDPVFFSNVFIENGADCITFHLEALESIEKCVELAREIRKKGVLAGISIKPKTSCECLYDVLNEFDLVLVMSVEPGFGGQKFDDTALDKIRKLKEEIEKRNCHTLIEVDGGINQATGLLCKNAGADVLVAGSYVFKQNIVEAVKTLK